MKIAVVAPSSVPFVLGGAERLWNGLTRAFNELSPHDAELIKLPTREHNLPDLMASYEMWSRLDVSHFDLVVSTKYPSWMVAHPNHVVYLQHTLRGLYDTYPNDMPRAADFPEPELAALQQVLRSAGSDRAALPETFGSFADALAALGPSHPAFAIPGPLARELVHVLDHIGLAPGAVQRHLAISATVAGRADYFPPGSAVRPLHHPSDLEGLRRGDDRYLFTASRLDPPKRIDMLIEAMRHVPGDVRLRIAGTGPEMARLQAMAVDEPRVELLGHVSTDQLVDLYADALAVPFIPVDEDLGLITLEAMSCAKPVVTTRDAGGATELVVDGRNGFVVAPDAASVGRALARLVSDRDLARRLGDEGHTRAAGVTWATVVSALLDEKPPKPKPPENRRPRSRRIVVVSTFPIYPRMGGGQLRCFHLYGPLAERFDVEVVSLTGPDDEQEEILLAPGFVETVVPKSAAHEAAEHALSATVHVPITDIAASLLFDRTPAYVEALTRACRTADAAILAHPFLQPALAAVTPELPVIYDAHNAEYVLKGSMLPETDAGRRLLDVVRQVEGAAVRDAVFVSVCSTEDEALLTREYDLHPAAVELVPNGVDVTQITFTDAETRAARREQWLARYRSLSGIRHHRRIALFTGSWHLPNIDGGRHVLDLAGELPEVLFLLAGGHCSQFETWELPDNVALLGVVSEGVKRALLACADVALNPMARGSGTNLKIVEYFAAGVPVVSTRLGSRGLAVQPDEHLRVADLPDFAGAVRETLDDPEGSAEMARRSRQVVEEHYDWAVLGARLRKRLETAVPRRVGTWGGR
jgi:glycosyltransferase involved in cell wall biosynthesis